MNSSNALRQPRLLYVLLTLSLSIAAPASGEWLLGPRFNVATDGTIANTGSNNFSISADGRYVAFDNLDSNLDPDDTDFLTDVFVRDTEQNTTVRISGPLFGSSSSGSAQPSISADGRFVAFASGSANLIGEDTDGDGSCDVGCDTNFRFDVFVHDRDTDMDGIFDEFGAVGNVRVSVTSAGGQVTLGDSTLPDISDDGRYVLFASSSSQLVPNDLNGEDDLFVHDRLTGTTVRISVASDGSEADDLSAGGQISADGRFVGFSSRAGNLVADDTNGETDAFLHDRDTDENGVFDEAGKISTTRISLIDGGGQIDGDDSTFGSMSGDGRYVAFMTLGSGVVPGPNLNSLGQDIFLRDLQAGTIERIGPEGFVSGNVRCCGNSTLRGGISDDGRFVALNSSSNVTVGTQTRGVSDVFVYDREAAIPLERITTSPIPTSSSDPLISARTGPISGDGTRLVVLGDLVEFLPPTIIGDEVLFIKGCSAADTNLELIDDTVMGAETFEACDTITVGPNYGVAGPNGCLTLRAGKAVVFGDGFSVGTDGKLEVEINPSL